MKKSIGYIIYQFWDFKTRMDDGEKWEFSTSSPHPEFKKRIYSDLLSAKDAVEQMKRVDFSNTSYHILPIYTDEEEYAKVIEAYKERIKTQPNN